jgi:alpha-beta hydrolase superfamily lysophospholipase
MEPARFILPGYHAHPIPMYGWVPAEDPLYIVHIAHGMAEYALRYQAIVDYFLKENIAVYAHDQRGHGQAVSNLSQQGLVQNNWFNDQVEDLQIILRHLRQLHPNKKIILLGHSMGSFIGQRYFQLYGSQIDGLMISATNGKKDPLLDFGIAVAWLQKTIFGNNYRSTLIYQLSFAAFNKKFTPNKTPNDWLSRDEEEVDKYLADKQCGFVCSAGFFYDFFRGIKAALNIDHINQIPKHIPVYAFAGDRDPVGLEGKGFLQLIQNWKAAGAINISYDLYKDGRHEMLNEINREEVISNCLQWIKNL